MVAARKASGFSLRPGNAQARGGAEGNERLPETARCRYGSRVPVVYPHPLGVRRKRALPGGSTNGQVFDPMRSL